MIVAAVTLWYFLVSDLFSGGEPKRSATMYPDRVTCEQKADFTHRTNFNVIVHLISARPVYDVKGNLLGQYQRACYSETVDPGRAPVVVIQQR